MRPIVIAVLVLGIGYAFFQFQQASRDDSGAIVSSGNVDAFALQVGDCFNDDIAAGDTGEVSNVAGVPCDMPHDNEVYAIFDLPEVEFPGVEEVAGLAADGCLARFEGFVGRDYPSSMLDIFTIYPTPDSWERLDDREVICALFDLNYNKLEGSMLGSGI